MMDVSPKRLRGTSTLFINPAHEVLLLLRDDHPAVPYPGMRDLPGGHIEPGETPSMCITREMDEEIGLNLTGHRLFARTEFPDRNEFTFWEKADLDIHRIDLHEGQRLRWFSESDVRSTPMAYGFNGIVDRFFNQQPFLSST